jgi:hypothetical protein
MEPRFCKCGCGTEMPTMLRVCKAMRGPQCTAQELAGQVRLHLEKNEASL